MPKFNDSNQEAQEDAFREYSIEDSPEEAEADDLIKDAKDGYIPDLRPISRLHDLLETLFPSRGQ